MNMPDANEGLARACADNLAYADRLARGRRLMCEAAAIPQGQAIAPPVKLWLS